MLVRKEAWTSPSPKPRGLLGRVSGRHSEAHHGGQRDVLVPLGVGRLLQDLAAELGTQRTGGLSCMGLWAPSGTTPASSSHFPPCRLPLGLGLRSWGLGAWCSWLRHRKSLQRQNPVGGQTQG